MSANAYKAETFGLDAYSPAEVQAKVEILGVKKARLPLLANWMLAMVAGGSIGLGAMFYALVLSDHALSFAVSKILGGVVFSLGLCLVVIGGAELFTSNCMIVMAWANRQIKAWEVLRNWTLVWLGNLVGALTVVFLLTMAHFAETNHGSVGEAILHVAQGKIAPDMVTLFFKGILCNILVCMAVWLGYAGRGVADKVLGMMLPVAAFIACGFEHCVANMFLLPMAYVLVATGHVPVGMDVSMITLPGIVHNLIPATLGNIVGGGGFVGLVYWTIYRKSLGGLAAQAPAEK